MTWSFTGRAVAKMVQKYSGSHPAEVEVMNDHNVIIQVGQFGQGRKGSA